MRIKKYAEVTDFFPPDMSILVINGVLSVNSEYSSQQISWDPAVQYKAQFYALTFGKTYMLLVVLDFTTESSTIFNMP